MSIFSSLSKGVQILGAFVAGVSVVAGITGLVFFGPAALPFVALCGALFLGGTALAVGSIALERVVDKISEKSHTPEKEATVDLTKLEDKDEGKSKISDKKEPGFLKKAFVALCGVGR